MLNIVIVEKTGELKSLSVKEFSVADLYKKCGFKKSDGFQEQAQWSVKMEDSKSKYQISVYAKADGRANSENKYDFPPPVDNALFFGSCAIVAQQDDEYVHLSVELWSSIYEKLFGGFEDLSATALEDENEPDELAAVPDEFKTKEGYLKDGFVVDDSELSEEEYE